jgi:outer membrane protein
MEIMRKSIISGLLMASTFSTSTAFAAQNLLDIYQLALRNDPTLASARSGNIAAQEKTEQGKALYRPNVSFNSNASHTEGNVKFIGAPPIFGTGGNLSYETYGYGLNVSQPIFRKQNIVQYQQSKIQVSQADKQLILAQQDLILRSAQAYFDVLQAQDKIDLINAQKNAIARQLEQAKANFDAGNATVTDTNEAQARFDLTTAQEIAANNELAVKNRALQSVIGQQPQVLASVHTTIKTEIPVLPSGEPADLDKWVEIAEQNNIGLSIQQQSLELANSEVDLQNAGHLPTLDAVGNFNNTRAGGSVNGFGSDAQTTTIGLQLQIPIYQGGAVSSKVREAVANKQKAQDDLEVARRKTDLDTQQAYLNLASNIAQVKAYEQALTSSQSQLDSTNLGYQVGIRTSVDVLNAQQQFYSAQRDLLQSRYSYLLSVLKLKSTSGLLNEADLEATNQQLMSKE